MSDDLKDILSHLNPDVDQETLMRYLQGKLSAAEQHELEKNMMSGDFDSDALEGLQSFTDKKDLASLVEQLNSDLKRRTAKKEKWRRKLRLRLEPWLIVAIVLILFLAILGYILVRHQLAHSS